MPSSSNIVEGNSFFLFFLVFFMIFLDLIRLDFGIEPMKIKKKGILDLVFDFFRFFIFSQACRFANAHEQIQLKSN